MIQQNWSSTVRITPLSWSDVDIPSWTWAFEASGEFLQTIREGERLPLGYGIAYYDYDRDVAMCMPVPINAIVGAIRYAYRWLRFSPWRHGVRCERCKSHL